MSLIEKILSKIEAILTQKGTGTLGTVQPTQPAPITIPIQPIQPVETPSDQPIFLTPVTPSNPADDLPPMHVDPIGVEPTAPAITPIDISQPDPIATIPPLTISDPSPVEGETSRPPITGNYDLVTATGNPQQPNDPNDDWHNWAVDWHYARSPNFKNGWSIYLHNGVYWAAGWKPDIDVAGATLLNSIDFNGGKYHATLQGTQRWVDEIGTYL